MYSSSKNFDLCPIAPLSGSLKIVSKVYVNWLAKIIQSLGIIKLVLL